MTKKEFFLRFLLWIFFVAIVPIITIADRYDMVKKGTLKYTGWAIASYIIGFIVVMVILTYISRIFKWSMWIQVLNGIRIVLVPLGFLWAGVDLLANNIENVKYILIVSFISEAVAIPINPIPKMLYMKNIKDLREALK